jgi:hypothetical protein
MHLAVDKADLELFHVHAAVHHTTEPELELHNCQACPAAANATVAAHVRQLWGAVIAHQTPARPEANTQLQHQEQQNIWSV